jgi:hypothetical protein
MKLDPYTRHEYPSDSERGWDFRPAPAPSRLWGILHTVASAAVCILMVALFWIGLT